MNYGILRLKIRRFTYDTAWTKEVNYFHIQVIILVCCVLKGPRNLLKTVIIDDHPGVRRCLRLMMEFEPLIDVVGEAGNGLLALEAVQTLAPDLLLLDINMPEMTGLEVLGRLRSESNSVYVIILSGHSDTRYVEAAMRLGANGYVGKDSGPEILMQAIHSIQNGQSYVDPNIAIVIA